MNIRDELGSLLRRYALSEGCNSQGAIRDIMTELIHISREAGCAPASVFESALEVADEEDDLG